MCKECKNKNNTSRPNYNKANYEKINSLLLKETCNVNASAQMSWNVFEINNIKDYGTKHTKV